MIIWRAGRAGGTCVRAMALAVCVLASGAARAGAQHETHGTIRGTVVDSTTNEPLQAVQVQIVQLHRGDLTHENGAFVFADVVPPGSYTLVFQRVGYRREVRTATVHDTGTVTLHVAMAPSAIRLATTTVTAEVGPRQSEEALRPTTVIAEAELERKLDVTIGATLQGEPGVGVVSSGPATGRPVIRGLGGDRILMLEDGARSGDLSASSPDHAVAVDPVTAERIEVVRGPAAILYGSNALGGVVNVVREEVPTALPDAVHGMFSLQGQSVNSGVAGGGVLDAGFGRIALRAEGSGRRAGDLYTPLGRLENTQIRTGSGSVGLGWVEDWGHVGAAYRFYDSSYGIPPDPVTGHAEGVQINMQRHVLRSEAHTHGDLGPFSSIGTEGVFTRYHHEEIEHGGLLGTEYGLLTGQGEIVARHERLGRFAEGAAGARVEWQDFVAGGSQGAPPARSYTAAGFLLEEMGRGRLRFQAGARYDWSRIVPLDTESEGGIGDVRTRTFGSFSGSVGGLLQVAPDVRVGASVARAFRTPGITELFSEGPHLAAYSYEIGNPDLEPEVGLGVDLFARVTRADLHTEVAVFRNSIANYIYPRATGRTREGAPEFQFAGEDAVLQGVEGRVEWTLLPRVVLDATASYVRGTLTDTREPLPLIPPLNGVVSLRYDTPRLFAGASVRAAAEQDRTGQFETPTEGYAVFNLTAGYRWLAVSRFHTVTLRLENITDREYREHLSRIKNLMPQAGRSVSLLYRVTF